MTVVRRAQGIEIIEIIRGYLVRRFYMGYTVADAKRLFRLYSRRRTDHE